MNNFLESYEQILRTIKEIEPQGSFINQIRVSKLSDIELIAIALTAEYLGIVSEYQLFRKLPQDLKYKIERSVYNRRKRKLFFMIEQLRVRLSSQMAKYEQYFIVDSMPLEVCKLSRSERKRIGQQNYLTSPDQGYCASQKVHYFGYKLHAVCTTRGVFTRFDLTKASVHDIHFLKDIRGCLNFEERASVA